mmetsp:Transcript_117672/g.374968  ORF Transcript_117672/g.374968 Transcript_117672/m.374968 type:complete len:356 (-) Transcript_117672:310-1377(-)
MPSSSAASRGGVHLHLLLHRLGHRPHCGSSGRRCIITSFLPIAFLVATALSSIVSPRSFVGCKVHTVQGPRGGKSAVFADPPAAPAAAKDSSATELPTSAEAMAQQAAAAVVRAFNDGHQWQTVRLRNDATLVPGVALKQQVKDPSTNLRNLVDKTLPLVKDFAARLWEVGALAELKSSLLDASGATMLYGEATDPLKDAAVFYVTGIDLVTSDKFDGFFKGMRDRLVVMVNPDQAAESPWEGGDVAAEGGASTTAQVSRTFREQSYYYASSVINGWDTILFRSYPGSWHIWLESLDKQLDRIGVSSGKPTYDDIVAMQTVYEEIRGISDVQKLGKRLKDQVDGFSVDSFFAQIR